MKVTNRDYAKEYQKRMEENSQIAIKIPKQLYADFSVKVEMRGSNKRAVLIELMEKYTYGEC